MKLQKLFIFTLLIIGFAACAPKPGQKGSMATAFTFKSVDGKKTKLVGF